MSNVIPFPGLPGGGGPRWAPPPSASGGAGGPGGLHKHKDKYGGDGGPGGLHNGKSGGSDRIPTTAGSGTLVGPDGTEVALSAEQQKALNCIISGMPFVFVGIRPTETGADFYRAAHGEVADLRNAVEHIHNQVDKALAAKGVL